jgi:hypothetical protein
MKHLQRCLHPEYYTFAQQYISKGGRTMRESEVLPFGTRVLVTPTRWISESPDCLSKRGKVDPPFEGRITDNSCVGRRDPDSELEGWYMLVTDDGIQHEALVKIVTPI